MRLNHSRGLRGLYPPHGVVLVAIVSVVACVDAAQDPGPWWDIDRDGITNSTELVAENVQLYGFNKDQPDANPSRAVGLPNAGSLLNGINLRDDSHAFDERFNTLRYLGMDDPQTDDWGTLDLIRLIEDVGRKFGKLECSKVSETVNNEDIPRRIQTGDMSRWNGGAWLPDHPMGTHQNGTEVDVRYMRTDGDGAIDLRSAFPSEYDQLLTADVMACFYFDARVEMITWDWGETGIIVEDSVAQRLGKTVIDDQSGMHANHFHVRIRDPDGN